MPIPFQCSVCGFSGLAEDAMAGKPGKCPKCKEPFRVPVSKATEAPPVIDTAVTKHAKTVWDRAKSAASKDRKAWEEKRKKQLEAKRNRQEAEKTRLEEQTEKEVLQSIDRRMQDMQKNVGKIDANVGCLLSIVLLSVVFSAIAALVSLKN